MAGYTQKESRDKARHEGKHRTTGGATRKKTQRKNENSGVVIEDCIFQKTIWNSCLRKSLNCRRDPGN